MQQYARKHTLEYGDLQRLAPVCNPFIRAHKTALGQWTKPLAR
jgi:hypothetical protein